MAECTTPQNIIGDDLIVGFAIGCGDADYLSLTYKPFGSISSKQLSSSATATSNDSDLSGATSSELITGLGFELSVSGFIDSIDSALTAQNEIIMYRYNEILTGRQPTVWIKIMGSDYPRVWHNFMNVKDINEGGSAKEAATVEFTLGIANTGTSQKSINLTAAI